MTSVSKGKVCAKTILCRGGVAPPAGYNDTCHRDGMRENDP